MTKKPLQPPPPPMAVPPVDKTDPALQARIAAFRAKYPKNEILRIGASVYHLLDSTPRTLVTYWPNKTDEPPVTLWSSADFSLLWGFASFIGSDGKTRSLMMTWSNLYTDCRQRLHAKHGKSYIAREAELKAHPPKPKDIILNYSLTDSADQPNEKGTARGTQATTRSTPGCSDLESEPLQSRQFPPDLTDKILRCEDSLFRPVYPGAFTSTKCDEEVCWKILPIVFDSLFVGHMFRTIVEGRFAKSAPS